MTVKYCTLPSKSTEKALWVNIKNAKENPSDTAEHTSGFSVKTAPAMS